MLKLIKQKNDFTSFFLHGYVYSRLCEPAELNFLEIYPFLDCNAFDAGLQGDGSSLRPLLEIQDHLINQYLSKLFVKFEQKSMGMWSGVDDGSKCWHNDFKDCDSFNTNFIIYMDDCTEENGNSISVRTEGFQKKLYPRRGEMLWLNHSKPFQHKASHKSGKRRVLSFEFLVDDLITSK